VWFDKIRNAQCVNIQYDLNPAPYQKESSISDREGVCLNVKKDQLKREEKGGARNNRPCKT